MSDVLGYLREVSEPNTVAALIGEMHRGSVLLAQAADEIEQLRRDVDSQDSVAYRNLDRLYRDQKRELNDVRFVVLELLRALHEMQERSMLPMITQRLNNALLAVEELVKYENGENDE